jgi:hypothetical protein
MYLDFTAMENCLNPASYGEICVGCNACGRINKETQKEDALELYKGLLQAEYEFDRWIEGMEELQKKNIAKNIERYKAKIAELEGKHEN